MRFFIFLLLVLAACGQQQPQQPVATLILFNGKFFTADAARPDASAVAMAGDRIIYVGDDAGAKALAGKGTETIDLQGAFAMPGLIEGHGHFAALGESLRKLNLLNTTSFAQVRDALAEKTKNAAPGDWIEGRGWHQEKWTESAGRTVNGYPYHDDISAVSDKNPVVLFHASGHALLANAKAMEIAGISHETPDPTGGRIVRDASGRAIGVFEENAMDLITRPLDQWLNQRTEAEKQADFDTTFHYAMRECLRRGITSFQDAGSSFWQIEQYSRLAQSSQFNMRLWAMVSQPKMEDLPKLAGFPKIGLGQNNFTVRSVKAYYDGALGSYGALLLQPYTDKPDSYGQNTTPIGDVRAIADACKARGLQYCVHAIGDRGNRDVLDVFRDADMPNTGRWRIEHAQHIDPADQPRFAQMGVIASMQAIHCTSDAPFVPKRLGNERARTGAYVWRNIIDSGAHLANGTDAPVEDVNPYPCLFSSVTRKYRPSDPAFYPEQCMTRQEALLSYTLWNAYAAFEEDLKGSLTVGKLADITVLDRDLLRCDVLEMPKTEVLKTIVGGKVVYKR